MSTIEQIRADIKTLRRELNCCTDHEQRVLLQLDLATAGQQLAVLLPMATSTVDISTITEYGLTQKLSNSIRCF